MGSNLSQEKPNGFGRTTSNTMFSQRFVPNTEHVVVQKDRKKKSSKLATIKKKLTRHKHHNKTHEYTKVMRELLSSWNSVCDVNTLVADYEATLALKNLLHQANLARPHANLYVEDLGALYDQKNLADVDLIYKNTVFPVHRAILASRCPFFKSLLSKYPHYGAQVPVSIRTPGVNVTVFSALLRYLYTGEFHSQEHVDKNLNLLIQLADEFGTPNALENDMKSLMETGIYYDAILVFKSIKEHDYLPEVTTTEPFFDTRQLHHRHEFRCHRAVLAARSKFFCNLFLRRERAAEQSLNTPTVVVLDEDVIPRRYARLLLNALYLDTVDLSCIVRSSVSMCSLSEVQAMVAGRTHMTETDEAMEIFQIAQFLDFPLLAQGCEDALLDKLCIDNVLAVLEWSAEPHGSIWLHRQALNFLQEEFHTVSANTRVLCELSKEYLLGTVQSDFLQASELEVLTAVLKWGEHQLIKRIEEREPNLLTHTTHSISRKGVRKRDLNDAELREILADFLPHVRVGHVLPRNSETLTSCVRRGLISAPPRHMLGDDVIHESTSAAWVRGRYQGVYIKPRVFLPYYEEAKSILEENLSQLDDSTATVRLRHVQYSRMPDTLYMLQEGPASPPRSLYAGAVAAVCCRSGSGGVRAGAVRGAERGGYTSAVGAGARGESTPLHSPCSVDIIAGTIPVPDQATVEAMIRRETELLCSSPTQRALKLPMANKRQLIYALQLRVVREFGLPDSSAQILHRSQQASYSPPTSRQQYTRYSVSPHCYPCAYSPPTARSLSSTDQPVELGASSAAAESRTPPSLCTSIPDIAIPSSSSLTSSLRRLQLCTPEIGRRRRRPNPQRSPQSGGAGGGLDSPGIGRVFNGRRLAGGVAAYNQFRFLDDDLSCSGGGFFYGGGAVGGGEGAGVGYAAARAPGGAGRGELLDLGVGSVLQQAEQEGSLSSPPGLELDLGDGTSHSGSRSSTFERRLDRPLYI